MKTLLSVAALAASLLTAMPATGKTFQAEPFPPFIQKIIADGGLMKSLTKK